MIWKKLPMNLKNRKVIITGATGGIGNSLVKKFVESGSIVLATGTSVGAWLASRWSVLKGDKTIKIFLIICVSVMSIKLWFFWF